MMRLCARYFHGLFLVFSPFFNVFWWAVWFQRYLSRCFFCWRLSCLDPDERSDAWRETCHDNVAKKPQIVDFSSLTSLRLVISYHEIGSYKLDYNKGKFVFRLTRTICFEYTLRWMRVLTLHVASFDAWKDLEDLPQALIPEEPLLWRENLKQFWSEAMRKVR